MRSRIPIGFTDVLVGALLCVLIGTASISAINAAQETANRAKCQSNLHQIGLAILLYQNDNLQLMPRTVTDTTGNPKPVWGTPYQGNKDLGPIDNTEPFGEGKAKPAPNDVTSALFLLMRNEQLTSQVFICPSTKLAPWDFGRSAHVQQDWTNWQGNDGLAAHLSYSYQNPYPSNTAIANGFQLKNPDATFAVAADMNPGGDAVTKVTLRSPMKDLQAANSLNHKGNGQNVLYGDGHAEYMSTPFCGTQHDNIYTASGPELDDPNRKQVAVVASPSDATDSILLPTAADIGYAGHPKLKDLTEAELTQMKKDVQGTYTAPFRGNTREAAYFTLTVDDKIIKCENGPLTILYNYQVIGTRDGGMLVALTAPKTKISALLSLEGKHLTIDMEGDFPLDFDWTRSAAK
jgi:prepilin-type processing-associated H-X9-DG protein